MMADPYAGVAVAVDEPSSDPYAGVATPVQPDLSGMEHVAPKGFEPPQDRLPFGDQVVLAKADNLAEKELYLQKRYGKDAVKREYHNGGASVVVTTKDGKVYRVGDHNGVGFVAQLTADSPTLMSMAAGAATGAEVGAAGGPVGVGVGGVLGAGAGALFGKGTIEAEKGLSGNFRKSPVELGAVLADTNLAGEEGEIGGQFIGKGLDVASNLHLPRFITGATAESDAATAAAWKAGARPGPTSYAPDLKKLARTEVIADKIVGQAKNQVERNQAYIKDHIRDTVMKNGYPDYYADELVKSLNDPEQAFSRHDLGENLKESVKAHREALTASVDKTAKMADSHIEAQLANVRKVIDSSKHEDLTGSVGGMVESAYKDFKGAASDLYEKAFSMTSDAPVVNIRDFSEPAERLVQEIKATKAAQVPAIIKRMSEAAGRQLDERDALLMNEFGIEIPEDGRISLRAAQRLRSVLRDKAFGGSEKLTHSTMNHDFGVMADAMDAAIKHTYSDPAVRPAVDALEAADKFYSNGIQKFKDVEINRLIKKYRAEYPPDAQEIVSIIAKPGYSSRTRDLRSMVGEPVWKAVQSVHMQQFLGDYVKQDAATGRSVVDGLKLFGTLTQDSRSMDTFRAVHGDDAVKDLIEMAKMSAARNGDIPIDQIAGLGPRAALESMRSSKARLDEFMQKNALRILADDSKTGEQAYQYLARPGADSEPHLLAAAKLFGVNSPQMKGLQQAALEEVARNASISAIEKSGSTAIGKALSAYTPNQLRLLFPGGLDRDLRKLEDVVKYMYPKESGLTKEGNAASITTGAIMNLPLVARVPIQVFFGAMRQIIIHPAFARFMVVGHGDLSTWAPRTAQLINKMAAAGAAETQLPNGE